MAYRLSGWLKEAIGYAFFGIMSVFYWLLIGIMSVFYLLWFQAARFKTYREDKKTQIRNTPGLPNSLPKSEMTKPSCEVLPFKRPDTH